MLRYKWKCSICGNEGHKWMSRYKVRRNGKVHMMKKHKLNQEPTIMKKII